MEFFKNFFNDDDKLIGLCAFQKKKPMKLCFEFETKSGTTKIFYDPKAGKNFFAI